MTSKTPIESRKSERWKGGVTDPGPPVKNNENNKLQTSAKQDTVGDFIFLNFG